MERRLIAEYAHAYLCRCCRGSTPRNYDTIVAIASRADDIRGYGPVKDESVVKAEAKLASADGLRRWVMRRPIKWRKFLRRGGRHEQTTSRTDI